MRKRWRKLVCALRGHRYVVESIAHKGQLVSIPRCTRCDHVDAEGVALTAWNRRDRRAVGRGRRRAR